MARKFPVQSYEWVPGDPETGRLGTMRPRYVETHWRKGEVTPGPESVVTRGLTEGMDAAGLDPEQKIDAYLTTGSLHGNDEEY